MPSLHNSLNFVLIQFVTSPTLALFFLQFLMNLVKYRQSDKAIKRSIWSCLLYLKFIIMVVLIRYKLRGSWFYMLWLVGRWDNGPAAALDLSTAAAHKIRSYLCFTIMLHFPKSDQQRNLISTSLFSDRRSKSSTVHGGSRPDHRGVERHSVCQS